jgi:rhodanese-related sulfurtransferase
MNETEVTILDVSQSTDHKKEHLENAMNIPLSKLETSLGQLEPFKEKSLLVFCQTGAQSPQACKKLYKLGFHQVINLVGGLKAWDEQKLPTNKSKT